MTTEGFSTSPAIRLLPKIGKVIEYSKASVVYPFMRRTLLRTPQMWEKYENLPKRDECFICLKARNSDMKYWAFCENEYPYDALASRHLMLVLKRHAQKPSPTEWLEILKVMDNLKVDSFQWNGGDTQSVKNHFHLHLINWKTI